MGLEGRIKGTLKDLLLDMDAAHGEVRSVTIYAEQCAQDVLNQFLKQEGLTLDSNITLEKQNGHRYRVRVNRSKYSRFPGAQFALTNVRKSDGLPGACHSSMRINDFMKEYFRAKNNA